MLIEFFLELALIIFILCAAFFSSVLQALLFCFAYLSWHLINAWRLWAWLQQSRHDEHLKPFSTLGIWQILVDRFYRMHMQLRDDAQQLKQLESVRRDFVANISHELRTPLTVLRGYLETLLDNSVQPIDTVALVKIHQKMQQQTLQMEHLVQDLLLLSRLEHSLPQPQHFTSVELAELFQKIQEDTLHVDLLSQHPIRYEIAAHIRILGEYMALFSAFSNLLINAMHYSPAGSAIQVKAWTSKDSVHIQFIDHGIGIAPHDLDRLTERFYRADNAKMYRTDGTGLGLAIVKHVLLRHHATLHIQSTLGQGSCFECIFPKTSN